METAYFDDWDVTEVGCALKAVTWTAPVKKQYTVDVPGADGSLDMASWFGGPRYESRTMTIVLEPRGRSLCSLWDALAQELYGRTCNIRLSVDRDYYWRGDIQSIVSSGGYPGEITVTVRVEPYKYLRILNVCTLPSRTEEKDAQIISMSTRVEVPEISVTGENLTITSSDGAVIKMGPGTYRVPELAIAPRSTLRFKYSGGPGEISFREAFL